MNANILSPPFSGPAPEQVPLARAPLVRVLVQVKFPSVLAVADPVAVAPFQERIRSTYPIGGKDLIQRLKISTETAQTIKDKPESIWRFEDRAKHWRVSLAPNFLAFETTRYTSRKDFLGRFNTVIEALEQTTLNPQITQRVGLRYVDRIEDDAIDRLHALIRPAFLGSQREFETAVRHMVTESLLSTEEGATILARWGMLPADTTTDPTVLEPAKGNSWILDLDMYTTDQSEFATAVLTPQLERFAKRIYAVFRFVVTDQFLAHYGGDR